MISILSPVFNEAAHIREMISSVQRQGDQSWELIFVDDASTDDTVGIVRALMSADSRIRLVSWGLKLGKVKAFNVAFVHSRGDVVVLLAGDDRLPAHSLAVRGAAVRSVPPDSPAAAFFKIRTFSDTRRFDGITLPKGNRSSRSGGSIAMNRALAEVLFPIDERLVSEDVWLAHAAPDLAKVVIEAPDIVLHYRIHDDNSNPRNRSFADMTKSMHLRHAKES